MFSHSGQTTPLIYYGLYSRYFEMLKTQWGVADPGEERLRSKASSLGCNGTKSFRPQ